MTINPRGMQLLPRVPGPSADARRHHLAGLLALAADGDAEAFMRFYDLTCATAYRAARAATSDAMAAEAVVCEWYLRAWTEASHHPASGLSPVAWLLAGTTAANLLEEQAAGDPPAHVWARGA
jgi:hypothetical protein